MATKKNGKPVGQPPFEITEEVIQQAERMAATGCTIEQIADSLGIHERTLYSKKAKFDHLEQAIKRGRGKGITDVSNVLYQAVMSGNIIATMFYLKCRAQWNDKEVDNKNNEEMAKKLIEDVKQLIDKSKMTI